MSNSIQQEWHLPLYSANLSAHCTKLPLNSKSLVNGAKYFTALDLQSGYYHMKLDEKSILKSAFMTVFNKFEFLQISFGLSPRPRFLSALFMTYLDLKRSSNKVKVALIHNLFG